MVYNPNYAIRQLSAGDTFVLEPTARHLEGLAGHVITIANQGEGKVITARSPQSLSEIFYEFEFQSEIDLLYFADEIQIYEGLYGVDGIEIERNHTRFVTARLSNVNVHGVTLNGYVRIYTPRVNTSMTMDDVNHFVVTAATHINITASSQMAFDRTITLFTIPIMKYGTGIDVPVGIRLTADGQFAVDFNGRVDTQFGMRNNRASAQVNVRYDFDFRFGARATVSANIQARARILLVPVYGIQGDFGRGLQVSSAFQERCPVNSCLVVNLFHVRSISSLDWGVLGWIPLLQFNLDLAPRGVYDFRYRSGGSWHRVCPHRIELGLARPDDIPVEIPPPQLSHLGRAVTLEQAQAIRGLFVKDGDMFIPIEAQWSSFGFANNVRTHFTTASEMMAVLFNPNFEIPRIPNNAQLVLIGETNIGIYETFQNGWTIPHGVNLGQGWNAFGVPSGSERVALLDYTRTTWGTTDAWFDTINGQAPLNFASRMVYTRTRFGLMPFHGLLTGSSGEEFTFARWEGTNFVQRTYVADRRFFTLPSNDMSSRQGIRANYSIERTPNGYFEINFFTPPVGYYGIGSSASWLNKIVYFEFPDAGR